MRRAILRRASLAIALVVGLALTSGCGAAMRSSGPRATPAKVAVASDSPERSAGRVQHSPPRQIKLPPDVQRWMELTAELGEQLFSAQRNCRTIATRLEAFTKKRRAELTRTNASLLGWEAEVDTDTIRAFYKKVRPHLDRRIDAAILCDKDPRARRAFDAFLKVSGLDLR